MFKELNTITYILILSFFSVTILYTVIGRTILTSSDLHVGSRSLKI